MRFRKYLLSIVGLFVAMSATALAGPITSLTGARDGAAGVGSRLGVRLVLEVESPDDFNLGAVAPTDPGVTAVPEPATLIMIGTGLLLVGSMGRKAVRRR